MIKKLKIEEVKATGETDPHGNPKSIIKVFGDTGFYVSSSKRVMELAPNAEYDLDVTEYTSKAGKPYYKVKMPAQDGQVYSQTSSQPSLYAKDDQLIIEQVILKVVGDMVSNEQVKLDDFETVADRLLAWIKKEPVKEATDEAPADAKPEVDLSDIPF